MTTRTPRTSPCHPPWPGRPSHMNESHIINRPSNIHPSIHESVAHHPLQRAVQYSQSCFHRCLDMYVALTPGPHTKQYASLTRAPALVPSSGTRGFSLFVHFRKRH
mmetsp:Transcript_52072/g.130813  ORF Transcript_52072/g.130813 Transcript_52072/m.130813 type:complete len:106 (-) Transcript_52072:316-633(-)